MPRQAPLYDATVSLERVSVIRGSFAEEDPWAVPPRAAVLRLRRAIDGMAPRLSTTVSIYFDEEYLSVVFSGADDYEVSTLERRDDPLYEEDVVEVFLAPRRLEQYFEFEVSPRGTLFDALIESPDGVRETMRATRSWNCQGLLSAVRKQRRDGGLFTVDTLLRIPFSCLTGEAPAAGEIWRANFFRIDRHPQEGDEYSAWQPTFVEPADFHRSAAFGALRFES